MIQINISVAMIGRQVMLSSDGVDNWSLVKDVLTSEPCDFEIRYDEKTYTGKVAMSEDGERLLVVFDEHVTLPKGVCIIAYCGQDSAPECPNIHLELTEDTKFSILDDNGCPQGFVTFGDILNVIKELIPENLCELYGEDKIAEKSLVAGDRILVTSGQCDVSSVSLDDIKCP